MVFLRPSIMYLKSHVSHATIIIKETNKKVSSVQEAEPPALYESYRKHLQELYKIKNSSKTYFHHEYSTYVTPVYILNKNCE